MMDLLKRKKSLIAGALCLLMAAGYATAQAEEKPMAAAQTDIKTAVSAPANTVAEEEKPTADLTVSVLNLYYHQGTAFSRNSLVIQPSMTIGYKGFTANLWGNLDTNPYPLNPVNVKHASNWTETDVTLAYGKTFGMVNTGMSYAYYGNAGAHYRAADARDQQEIGLTLGLNTLLNPTLNAYYMIDNSQRWYFMLGVSHAVAFNKAVSLKLSATAGYMASDMNAAEMDGTRNRIDGNGTVMAEKYNGFLDGVVSAAMPVKVTKSITVTPSVALAFPLGKDAENYMKYNSYTDVAMSFSDKPGMFLIYGMAAAYSF